ncbi:Putative deoxyribonuclease yjjV [Vibrio cholerae]|nr:Putative deoxyribonuclease yjjV [Vibrio cholerae]
MQAEQACVAVGECGLDGMIDVDVALQEQMLIAQLSMASQAKLPANPLAKQSNAVWLV